MDVSLTDHRLNHVRRFLDKRQTSFRSKILASLSSSLASCLSIPTQIAVSLPTYHTNLRFQVSCSLVECYEWLVMLDLSLVLVL